jgi:hypothetical protein
MVVDNLDSYYLCFLAILEEKFEDTKGEIEGQAMQ